MKIMELQELAGCSGELIEEITKTGSERGKT